MSIASPATGAWLPPPEEIFRITVEQYEEWSGSGSIGEEDRVELLDGVIVRKMTKNPPHLLCCDLCRDELTRILPPGFWLRGESPVRIAPVSMPEPDLIVLRGSPRDLASRLPLPSDVVLCVEVADSSLARDRGVKRDLSARAGISNYWLVNLTERRVEVFADPKDGAYATASVAGETGSVGLVVDGEAWGRVEVAAILP